MTASIYGMAVMFIQLLCAHVGESAQALLSHVTRGGVIHAVSGRLIQRGTYDVVHRWPSRPAVHCQQTKTVWTDRL